MKLLLASGAVAVAIWGYNLASPFIAQAEALYEVQLAQWMSVVPSLLVGTSLYSGNISATVTPGCSALLSIFAFAGILGVAHIDMDKSVSTTLKALAVSVPVLVLVNSVRIALLIRIAWSYPSLFWPVHDWLGWMLFMAFYLPALWLYARKGR